MTFQHVNLGDFSGGGPVLLEAMAIMDLADLLHRASIDSYRLNDLLYCSIHMCFSPTDGLGDSLVYFSTRNELMLGKMTDLVVTSSLTRFSLVLWKKSAIQRLSNYWFNVGIST